MRDLKGKPVREGYVLHNEDKGELNRRGELMKENSPFRDAQTSHAVYRVCDRAGLPARSWHVLRHYADVGIRGIRSARTRHASA